MVSKDYDELVNINEKQQEELALLKKENEKLKETLDNISPSNDKSSNVKNIESIFDELLENEEIYNFFIDILSSGNYKQKLLNLSDSYQFYKNGYETLLAVNENLNNEVNYLKRENSQLKESMTTIIQNQEKFISLIRELTLAQKNQNDSINNLISSQKSSDVKLTGLVEKTNTMTNTLINNAETLSLINEASLRIEKTSTYSTIKIDSKFNQGYRLLETLSTQLNDNIQKQKNTDRNASTYSLDDSVNYNEID